MARPSARTPEEILDTVLSGWAGGIARHEPDAVALLFSDDALFQGFDPEPAFGRAGVAAYYDKQPFGLTADYDVKNVRQLGDGTIVGYAHVSFTRPDAVFNVYLTVILSRVDGEWLIRHYHVSRIQ